jgi:hypothetical protein
MYQLYPTTTPHTHDSSPFPLHVDNRPLDMHLESKFTLHRSHNKPPLLFAHKLIHIRRPIRTTLTQIVHTIAYLIQFLRPLVELARRPGSPSLLTLNIGIGRGRVRRV